MDDSTICLPLPPPPVVECARSWQVLLSAKTRLNTPILAQSARLTGMIGGVSSARVVYKQPAQRGGGAVRYVKKRKQCFDCLRFPKIAVLTPYAVITFRRKQSFDCSNPPDTIPNPLKRVIRP
jgi:hypothetical protein